MLMLSMQLPTGSCVLKHFHTAKHPCRVQQLPTGSCVLKHFTKNGFCDGGGSYLRVVVC